jgi:glycosyltransferase involved in cell wall biosynthesis
MRILHVNKFLYRRGGAEAYMFDLAALQRSSGHEVEHFAMRYPDNDQSRFERWFPAQVDFDPAPPTLEGKLRGAGRLLWSSSAARGMRAVLDEFRPDLVHLHNIYHQLSPSVLQPIRAAGIPAVMTLHDYKLACPTYRFLDHGRICEACVPRRFWSPAVRRCNGGSVAASALNGLELTLHTLVGAYGSVQRFACPSRFLEGKMRASRIYPDRLRWVPNFVDVEAIRPKDAPGAGVVYAGRLSDEKGVDVLIEAASRAPRMRVDIAGEGPARGELERLAEARDLNDRVRFHGRLETHALTALLRTSAVMAVPSRWYENMPISVLEAFASGLPVVASALGGLPELIEHRVDGLVVPPDDPEALADAVEGLIDDPARAFEMGRAARAKAEQRFAPEHHLARLDAVYQEASDLVTAAANQR